MSAIALFSLPVVTCRADVTDSSWAVTPAMCRAACAGPRFVPYVNVVRM
jgi:hypothetical protein